MSDTKNNCSNESLKEFSYQPTEQRSYQPTNNSASNKTPEQPKSKSAEKQKCLCKAFYQKDNEDYMDIL